MDYAALTLMPPLAAAITAWWLTHEKLRNARAVLAAETEKKVEAANEYLNAYHALQSLRRNCFLTDTDGVRRRYDKVSRAVRERAEGN